MNIFAGLKHFLKLAGISAAGPSTLLRRIAAILLLFYGILTTLLYLVFEAKTFQERAECIMFLNSLSNGSTLYLLSLWRQDIFALLDEMQIKINRREWGKLQHVVFQTWSIFFFNLAWNSEKLYNFRCFEGIKSALWKNPQQYWDCIQKNRDCNVRCIAANGFSTWNDVLVL